MTIPKSILSATMAGLALTLTTSCEKEALPTPADSCDEQCHKEGCVSPEQHGEWTKDQGGEYYCPPCGMG